MWSHKVTVAWPHPRHYPSHQQGLILRFIPAGDKLLTTAALLSLKKSSFPGAGEMSLIGQARIEMAPDPIPAGGLSLHPQTPVQTSERKVYR